MPLTESPDGVILRLKITPKTAKNALVRIEREASGKEVLRATVTAVPEKGKANAALIKLLAKKLGLPKTSISLIAGDQSRHKTALITGDTGDLMTVLKAKFRALGLMG